MLPALPLFRKEGRGEIYLVQPDIAFPCFQGVLVVSGHGDLESFVDIALYGH